MIVIVKKTSKVFALLALLLLNTYACTRDKPKKGVTHTIEIKNMKFVPEVITVAKGDKVTWINKDFVQHDITDELKKTWSSKPIDPNKSWTKVITKNESYFCNLHKVMKGKIIVR